MTSWPEQMKLDPALAAFVQSQIAQAGIDTSALTVENAHLRTVITAQLAQIDGLRLQLKLAKKS